jgi:hypothetical protein
MIEKLLSEIRAGGTLEVNALAKRLGTSAQVVEAMLEHLQRSGLIAAYASCADRCAGCSLSDSCGTKAGPAVRLWQSSGPVSPGGK